MSVKSKKCGVGKCKNKALPGGNYCSLDCYLIHKPKTKVTKKVRIIGNTDLQPKPIKKIANRSKSRAAQEREYQRIRKVFLEENHICPVTNQPATEVHHKKGRIGTLLTDRKYFLAVSAEGHHYIETHPAEAYEKGWSLKRNAI